MKELSVILADRHHAMLEGIRGLLETVFESVVMVADEKSLFDTARKLNPVLAIVDISLSLSGEINIVKELKSRLPDLKFIILSVHDEETVAKEVMEAGASGFVLKRSAGVDLIPAVMRVLKGKTFISPGVDSNSTLLPI